MSLLSCSKGAWMKFFPLYHTLTQHLRKSYGIFHFYVWNFSDTYDRSFEKSALKKKGKPFDKPWKL